MDASSPTALLPVIDISPLVHPGPADRHGSGGARARAACIEAIGRACREVGFFYVTNHGVSESLQAELEASAATFFALPAAAKRKFAMARGGKAWRGYFSVGEELTSGVVDEKEGLYFGDELPASDPRPLHGPNLWPSPALRRSVTRYMQAMEALGRTLLSAIAASLGLRQDHFGDQFINPTKLFRIFHYPPHDEVRRPGSFAVGEHSDYGYLTILKQDDAGGLQVKRMRRRRREEEQRQEEEEEEEAEAEEEAVEEAEWVDAPPVPGSFVINLGDALEHNTGSLLRATPHRVAPRTLATSGRFSFPFFFDPSFDAPLRSVLGDLAPALQREAAGRRRQATAAERWDGKDVTLFEGTFGDYLLSKVSKVFPELAGATPEVQARL
eukprot:g1687.t1